MRPSECHTTTRRLVLSSVALALVGATVAFAGVPGPIPAIVQSVHERRPIVTLHVGADDGVDLGDDCVILEANRPIATGMVFYVEARTAGVMLAARSAELRVGQAAFVLPESLTRTFNDQLPTLAPRYASLTAVAPGGGTAWLDAGTADGVYDGDRVAVIRNGVVARLGRIATVDEAAGLVAFDDTAASGAVRVDDRVRIMRAGDDDAPIEHVREAFVTGVSAAPDGQQVSLGGASAIDFAPERRVDLFRGETYVGFAIIEESTAGRIVARTEQSFCQTECQPGDTARLRPPPDVDGVVRRGWAFIVDRNYALISLGDNDGLVRGSRLYGPAGARPALELTVQSVYPDHCGAAVADGQTGSIPHWGEFRTTRIEDTSPRLGRVTAHPLAPWLAEARLDDDAPPPPPGTLLVVGGPSPATVLVIDSHPREMLLYTPACWRLDSLEGRPVRSAEPIESRANEPSVIETPTADTASLSVPTPDKTATTPPDESSAAHEEGGAP